MTPPDPRTAEERLRAALLEIAAMKPIGPFAIPTDELSKAKSVARAALAVEPVPVPTTAHSRNALDETRPGEAGWHEYGPDCDPYERHVHLRARRAIRWAAEPVPVPEVDAAWEALYAALGDDAAEERGLPHWHHATGGTASNAWENDKDGVFIERAAARNAIRDHRPIIEAAILDSTEKRSRTPPEPGT